MIETEVISYAESPATEGKWECDICNIPMPVEELNDTGVRIVIKCPKCDRELGLVESVRVFSEINMICRK